MLLDKVLLRELKDIRSLQVEFCFPDSRILVVTGKNGVGKTSLVKAYHLLKDPEIFSRSSGLNAVRAGSYVGFQLKGYEPFEFSYNEKLGVLDSKSKLPSGSDIVAELSVPYGERFSQFSLIAKHDSEIRVNIASSSYDEATDLIGFLRSVYGVNKFDSLKVTKVGRYEFYFLLRQSDFYIREDHFSAGEYFLVQLFRLIRSGAKIIFIDEMDLALDAAAQAKVYRAMRTLIADLEVRVILVSHSLAFLSTVDDGGLYYLESSDGQVSLEMRSFGYIKSDLYGFYGCDRYIVTEDDVLEGFVRFLITSSATSMYYKYEVIGLGGYDQLRKIIEKNAELGILAPVEHVLCVLDGDAHNNFVSGCSIGVPVAVSPVLDIELYIYDNRDEIFPHLGVPPYKESDKPKKASKAYWKWLVRDKCIDKSVIYQAVIDREPDGSEQLRKCICSFLER